MGAKCGVLYVVDGIDPQKQKLNKTLHTDYRRHKPRHALVNASLLGCAHCRVLRNLESQLELRLNYTPSVHGTYPDSCGIGSGTLPELFCHMFCAGEGDQNTILYMFRFSLLGKLEHVQTRCGTCVVDRGVHIHVLLLRDIHPWV